MEIITLNLDLQCSNDIRINLRIFLTIRVICLKHFLTEINSSSTVKTIIDGSLTK